MTNKEILEKAIQKAIDGGFNKNDSNQELGWFIDELRDYWIEGYYSEQYGNPEEQNSIEKLIFNHDFAKALWGEDTKNELVVEYSIIKVPEGMDKLLEQAREDYQVKRWQYHLQQMVIAEDPIKYLGEHLEG